MAQSPEEILDNTTLPMAVSGVTKRIIPDQARRYGLDWYYIDGGYFGNGEFKKYLRVTKNARHAVGPVIARPNDRLKKLNLDRTWHRRGRKILLVPPDDKVCETYGLPNPDEWTSSTVATIKQHTDRPVEVRLRPASRHVRTTSDRFVDVLQNDVNAVVVFSSNAGVESAMHGIPVVVLGECGASSVASPLDAIDDLPDLDPTQIDLWLRYLSYCQFTLAEMKSGFAWRTLNP